MNKPVFIELILPGDWKKLCLPMVLNERLQVFLDRQAGMGKLTVRERREAEGLAELVDILSLLKLRVKSVQTFKSGKFRPQ